MSKVSSSLANSSGLVFEAPTPVLPPMDFLCDDQRHDLDSPARINSQHLVKFLLAFQPALLSFYEGFSASPPLLLVLMLNSDHLKIVSQRPEARVKGMCGCSRASHGYGLFSSLIERSKSLCSKA